MSDLDPFEADVGAFRTALLEFYRSEARALPWRDDPDPYRVFVSEMMLQQTRVETVVPYFERWMERLPSLEALAAADTDEVLKLWEGLGYYSRARNLHRAVREVVASYGGQLPSDPQVLLTLPGVGPYTAGAVASIAFGVRAPAVDGNVRRVLARLMDLARPGSTLLRESAERLVDPDRPGDFNQALMELGARVCTPRRPDCARCPVVDYCRAETEGTQESRPAPRKRRPVPKRIEGVAALVDGHGAARRVMLRRRLDESLLGGMWELPGAPVQSGEDPGTVTTALASRLADAIGCGAAPELERALEPVKHAFTHLHMRYHAFVFRLTGAGEHLTPDDPELRWVARDDLDRFPIPTAQTKMLSKIF